MNNLKNTNRLRADFEAICDCGGRMSGTASERRAVELLKQLGEDATGVAPRVEELSYRGWRTLDAELLDADGRRHDVNPLVRTVATPDEGLEAEVLDLGRGTPEEFAAYGGEIPGRIVMVRHELMFAPGTIHRRKKYNAAKEAGAAGFLIAGPVSGSVVSGSSGRDGAAGIPAAGISPETAARLVRTAQGRPRARLRIATEEQDATAANLFFDLAGQSQECVVLSAHIDGHDLAESAIDNGTGLAVCLEVARRLAASVKSARRGLRLSFFNIEEWALAGSAAHVAGLSEPERQDIVLNANLDSVAGGARLTALTSGFVGIEGFLLSCAESAGIALNLFRPLQTNSDHANFAAAGIPAFRLVAGFGDPSASTAQVLTSRDRRDLVNTAELERAAALTETIVKAALSADPQTVAAWRGTVDAV